MEIPNSTLSVAEKYRALCERVIAECQRLAAEYPAVYGAECERYIGKADRLIKQPDKFWTEIHPWELDLTDVEYVSSHTVASKAASQNPGVIRFRDKDQAQSAAKTDSTGDKRPIAIVLQLCGQIDFRVLTARDFDADAVVAVQTPVDTYNIIWAKPQGLEHAQETQNSPVPPNMENRGRPRLSTATITDRYLMRLCTHQDPAVRREATIERIVRILQNPEAAKAFTVIRLWKKLGAADPQFREIGEEIRRAIPTVGHEITAYWVHIRRFGIESSL